MARKAKSSNALDIIHRRYFEGRPERLALLEEERQNANVARQIHTLREKAGLTQAKLAKLVGTSPSVISRLEAADYRGHSLSMLRRIAAALDQRIEIRLVARRRSVHA